MKYAVLLIGLWVPLLWASEAPLQPLQPLIDQAEEGDLVQPPPGIYAGPVIIDKPLILDGRNQVIIDGLGKGSVIVLDTDGATVKRLRIRHSGDSPNRIDAGVQVRGNFNVIKDNIIEDCLFGVDLQQSNNNIVRGNQISSKDFHLGQRGDSVRLWYSFDNQITDNRITHSRDMVVWYSANNTIARNHITDSRYSLHFMYSRYNLVEDNTYIHNTVGIFLMYSDSVVVRNNFIAHAVGPTGVGIGFKETSDLTIEGNQILYCANGLYIDVSPYQPDTTNRFEYNIIAYNGIGIRFLNDWHGNHFRHNQLVDNLTQVVVSGGGTANRNLWQGNYWSDYEGFDLNQDGIGDTPYELYVYADRLWQDEPYAQFFKGTPLLEVIDFLERLAPFSEPRLLVRDSQPQIRKMSAEEWQQALRQPESEEKDEFDALRLLRQSLEND